MLHSLLQVPLLPLWLPLPLPVPAASNPLPFLPQLVTLLAAAAAIAYISFRIRVLPIVGFLVAGVLIGPNQLGLVPEGELVDSLAEIGVILLLFTIGIEFRLEQLARIKRQIFVGGGLQVLLTVAAVTLIGLPFGVDWRNGLFTGCLVALSSTAIVLKLLADRRATDGALGQQSIAILIFQDLAVVAMVLLVPMLGDTGDASALGLAWALVKAAAIVGAVLVFARRVVPPILEAVARTCSPEIFLLTLITLCFGTAWLTSLAGVSLALGAFLAGLLASESRFSHHALGEIMPLQILFSATFFVSVGMLLDLGFLVDNLPLVLLSVVAVILVKAAVTAASARLLRLPVATAVGSGLLLAQIGEFSFVLQRTGADAGLSPADLGDRGSGTFIATSVILILATPVLASFATTAQRRLGPGVVTPDGSPVAGDGTPLNGATPAPLALGDSDDHVIVNGWGSGGRALARALKRLEVPFVVVTLNPEGALEAEAEDMRVIRGATSRLPALQQAGVGSARVLVVADDDQETTVRAVTVARNVSADLRIVARADTPAQEDGLRAAGADAVVIGTDGDASPLLSEVLDSYGLTRPMVREQVARARQATAAASAAAGAAAGATATVVRQPMVWSDAGTCTHLDQIRAVTPSSQGCEECLKLGDKWVHLRLCLSCGHVGCCDISKNKHASKHFQSTGHPIVESFEPNEDWRWCFVDKTYV